MTQAGNSALNQAPFGTRKWELYNLDEDFTQSRNLADQYPDKLAELVAAFDKEAWGAYLNSIERLDPEKWIMFAAPAKLHFQFASNDEWVQTLEQVDLYRAASQPKSRQMFEADELLNDEAKKDRHAWLRRVLLGK